MTLDEIDALPVEALPAALADLAAMQARIAARMAGAASPCQSSADRLLSADDAASLLGSSREWLVRNAPTLPFSRKRGRVWRFSAAGIQRYIARA